MRVKLQKTGHATPNGTFVISVRGGVVESIKTGNETDLVWRPETFGRYDTIEDIFDFIEMIDKQREKNGGFSDVMEIEYDSKLGYPKKVNLDLAGVLDEELLFEVLQFETLE